MLRYFRVDKDGNREEITRQKATDIVLGSYKDNDMTRDMVMMVNRIKCQFSDIEIIEEGPCYKFCPHGVDMVPMPGLYNMLPMDSAYDDNGNRIRG